ncbi:hypothetical protein [Salinarimonas soli]|uniref:hypothetical protein n=1 Tax=Salinarimonas soli TaxID=1638099 RepID=UPI001661C4DD|nr:hypothetical protein [Salinarimonas soli]
MLHDDGQDPSEVIETAMLLDPGFDDWGCDLPTALRLANQCGVERAFAVKVDGDNLI